MPINDSNSSDQNDNTLVVLTSGDLSGNKADVGTKLGGEKGLHVISDVNVNTIGAVPSINNALRFYDMNATNGGVARNTNIGNAFTSIYDKDGSGLLFGFIVTVDTASEATWYIRLMVDSVDIFGTAGISFLDMKGITLYNLDASAKSNRATLMYNSINFDNNTFMFNCPANFPIRYSTNITIQLRKQGATKPFRAGLVTVS